MILYHYNFYINMSHGTKSSILQILDATYLWKVKLVHSKHHVLLRKDPSLRTLYWVILPNEELQICNTVYSQAAMLHCSKLTSLAILFTLLLLCLMNFKQFLTYFLKHIHLSFPAFLHFLAIFVIYFTLPPVLKSIHQKILLLQLVIFYIYFLLLLPNPY